MRKRWGETVALVREDGDAEKMMWFWEAGGSGEHQQQHTKDKNIFGGVYRGPKLYFARRT